MKKILAIYVSAVLLLSSVAWAEEYDLSSYDTETLTNLDVSIHNELSKRFLRDASSLQPATVYDEEILFRNIPWGVNVDDEKSALQSTGFFTGKCDTETSARLVPWSLDPEDADSYWDSGIRLYQYSFSEDVKVAGYNVGTVNLYFMYQHDGVSVNRDSRASELYKVSMELETADYDLAYADLVNKLSSLYGNATETSDVAGYCSTDGNYHQYNWWASWYGKDNTAVLLHLTYDITDEDNKMKGQEITLYYGKTNSEIELISLSNAMTEEAKEAERQNILNNANNTDGL